MDGIGEIEIGKFNNFNFNVFPPTGEGEISSSQYLPKIIPFLHSVLSTEPAEVALIYQWDIENHSTFIIEYSAWASEPSLEISPQLYIVPRQESGRVIGTLDSDIGTWGSGNAGANYYLYNYAFRDTTTFEFQTVGVNTYIGSGTGTFTVVSAIPVNADITKGQISGIVQPGTTVKGLITLM